MPHVKLVGDIWIPRQLFPKPVWKSSANSPIFLLIFQVYSKYVNFIYCPGLICGINIVKPRFLFKTVDLWSYIMPIDRYSQTL